MKQNLTNLWLKLLLGGAVLAAPQIMAPYARASSLGTDPFLTGANPSAGQYSVGGIDGQNPTIAGFSGAWYNGGASILTTSLSPTMALNYGPSSSGGSISVPDWTREVRLFDSSISNAFSHSADSVVYISFLMQRGGTDGNDAEFEMYGGGLDDGTQRAFQIGGGSYDFPAGQYAIKVNNDNGLVANLGDVNTGVNVFLIKFNLSSTAGADSVTAWLNPVITGTGDPAGGTNLSGLSLRMIDRCDFGCFGENHNTVFDELRIGTTLADVIAYSPNSAPAITQQPVSMTSFLGSNIVFSVIVASNNLTPSYQWKAGAIGTGVYTNLSNGTKYSGVTSSDLVVSNLTLNDGLDYVVVITNAYGSVTSTPPTTLTVITPGVPLANDPILIGATPANGQYTVGGLAGQNPIGTGFSGAWIYDGSVSATSLSYSNANYTAPQGGAIVTINGNRTYRHLNTTLQSLLSTNANETVYMSILGNFSGGEGWWGYAAFELGADSNDSKKALAIGMDSSVSGNFMYQINNGAKTDLGVASDGNTHLFLVKFNLSSTAASDAVTIWVDPVLGGVGDPSGGLTVSGLDLFAMNDLQIGSGADGNQFDEIRLGITLASVINPAPSRPENIATAVSGNNLQLSWPTAGWRLQVQTNLLSGGLGTNWVDVPNSNTVNQTNLPVVQANGAVFYRLIYP